MIFHFYNIIVNFQTPIVTNTEFANFSGSFCICCLDPAPVSNIIVRNDSETFSELFLTWMEANLTTSMFSNYTVFYLPVRGPYGDIMASNRKKRQSIQPGELAMSFTGTNGTLTNLNGAVTYRIQMAVVVTINGLEVTGDRSDAIEMTTLEGGEQIFAGVCMYQPVIILVPTAPRNLTHVPIELTGNMFNITLTWSRPDPPHGLIIQYNVSGTTYSYCL